MTDLTNRDAVYWCLILSLGLCLMGQGAALSVNLVLLLVEAPPEAIYPVGGPLSLLAGGLCLSLAFASRRLSRLMALLLILVSLIQLPLALANIGLIGADLPRVGVLPGLPVIVITGCLGYLIATREDEPTGLIKLIAAATIAGGAVNLFAGTLSLPAWARLTIEPDLSPATAMFLMIVGAMVLLAPRHYQDAYRDYRRSVIWVGILGIVITVSSWYLARHNHDQEMQQQAELIASQTSESIRDFYDNELATIARLAERVENSGGILPERAWQQEIKSYLRDMPHLQMVALMDHRQRIIKLETRNYDTRFWLSRQFSKDEFRAWFGHDHGESVSHSSRVYRGPDEHLSVFLAAPVQFDDGRPWSLLALTSVDQALQWLNNRQAAGMTVEVTSADNVLYQTRSLPDADRLIRARKEINLDHDLWTLTISEPLTGRRAEGYATETLILFGGLALTVLVMVSRLLAAITSGRNQRLEEVNHELQTHLSREQELRETNERIINFSSDLLCIIDRHGMFRFVSPSSKRILGYAPSDMEGRSSRDFVLECDWETSHKAANRLRSRQPLDTPQLRNRYRHRDGHVVTLDWKARASSLDGTMFCVGRDMTAELKAEKLAQQREAFFSLTPEMFCIVADNHFLEVNQAFLRTLGYSRTDLLDRPYLEIIHPDYHDQVAQAVDKLVRGDAIYELELLVLHHKGMPRWLRLNASMQDQRIYCSARDITREKEVKRELTEKEHLLSMAEHIGRLGGWMVDRASGKSTWSDAVCEIYELPPGKAPDVHEAICYYTPEYRPRAEEALAVATELGLPFDYEARIQTAKGRFRWVRVIGETVRDENGEIVTLQGALQDITASKEANDQIRRLAERQSRIFESITDAFFTLDREWRITFMNQKTEQIIDRSRSDVLGDSLWEIYPELIGTEFDEQYQRAMETGETTSFEAWFSPRDLWCEVKAYPSEEGLAIYFRSINERKLAEQELEATMAELERSNRELQDFAFVASHDLQEPLRKIQTFSDRLLRAPDHFDEREQDYLQRMQAAAKRMQTLIMDLLSYSRVSTQAQPFQSCDLNQIVEDVLQDLELAISAADARIEASSLPTLEGDPSQLRQVIQNLLSNAIKFRRSDVKPEILIYPENVTDRGWTMVIQDNGAGFDPRYADRMFQPFQRLHSKNEYVGTGIGLAIVRKIVERHHGTIVADGQPGEGAVFRIHFSNAHAPSGHARENSQL